MRRERFKILEEILLICKGGSKKHGIIQRGNLNYISAGQKLNWLIEKKLIEKEGDIYHITSSGSELLADLKNVILK